MNKSSKFLFVSLTLLLLLVSVGSITAADNDSTTTTLSDNVASTNHDTITSNTEKIVETSQKLESTTNKDVKKTNKNLTKKTTQTDKQTKKDAVETTQTATNYETLKTTWNNIKNNGANETSYIINVKNGNYNFDEQLEINNNSNIKSITINGEDVDKTIFDGQNKTRFFNINTTTLKIAFNNITFKNGFNETQAGAIYDRTDMKINNSKFINNRVYSESEDIYTLQGGAIYIYAGNTTINHSSFINNSAESTKTGYCNINGGAIAYNSISGRFMFVNITFCDFINNSVISNENSSYPKYSKGGVFATSDGRVAMIGGLNATNCNFIGNHANVGSIGSFSYVSRYRPTTVKDCVIDKNTGGEIFDYSGSRGIDVSSNYYPNGSDSSIITLVNGEYPIKVINQRTNNVTINMITELTSHDEPTTMLGNYYEIPIKSSSSLINTSNISLSADNKYTAIINLSNLPVNHENITLYAGSNEVAKIIWDYTNVEFNNITAKPGNNIILNATFKTSNNKLIPNGRVAFKINGCTIGHSNIEFGTATLNYTIPENYSAKDYILTVVYGGSSQFIQARTNATLHLKKLATTVDVKTSIDENTLKITVDPRDENGNTVKDGKICVKIEGKTLQTLKITGKTQVNFTIPKSWNNREIRVLAIYGENNNHKQSRMEIKTKLVLPNTKTTKKDEVINNYYVSDQTGSDTNTGSQTSPFKTIQKAIQTIQNNGQAANVYLNGNFKGVGNTNLTVPGNLKINFIGIGNSSIDGEVNYTIKTQLTDGEYYWGSTPIWYPYNNGTGNWAMNITGGSGLITITNFTIKNCWNPGGTDMTSYKTGSITNNGNLEVNNVSFIYNHGGVGASIKNNNGGNLKVTNSLFEANRKSNSTGNYGAGIYNNGTATIINSTFQKNYARWGTITNDKNMTIINSTIRDNIGYDGGSTFKTGSAITINTGSTTFDVTYNVTSITTIIDECYFTNNDQLDIYADEGDLNITNSVFNKSTGIVVPSANTKNIKYNIINNTIDSPIGSSLYTSLSSTSYQILAFRLYGNYIYLIENNTVLNLGSSESKALELQSSNSIIKNNTFTRIISITGSNNTITGNNITTTMDLYTITIPDTTSRFNIIENNYLSASGLKGNAAINSNSNFNTIENNTPKTEIITINDDTFYKYFDDDGNILPAFNSINLIEISGLLSNKNININHKVSITQTNKVTLLNITVNINSSNLSISGLNIENKNNNPIIMVNANNITVSQTKLMTNANYTVILNGNDNNISNNELVADIFTGNDAVLNNGTNIIESNTPTYKNYVLTDDTYSTYFDNNGKIKPEFNNNIHFLIKDSMHNKNMIFNLNNTVTIVGSEELVLYNTTIKVEDTTYLNMSYVNIENTNNKVALQLNVAKSMISYNNITTNTNAINIENVTGCEINIQNNNIIANSTENVTTINIINSNGSSNVRTTSQITDNIITTYGPALKMNNGNIATVSIGLYNSSGFKIRQNRITTNYNKIIDSDNVIASISMRSPIKANLIETQYNTITTNGDDKAISLNVENYSVDIYDDDIITNAKTSISILANESDTNKNSIYGSYENTGSNCYSIIIINSENMRIFRVDQKINAENIVGFLVMNSSNNITFSSNNMVLNGSDVVSFKVINSANLNISNNNITTTTNGTNSDFVFINSSSNSVESNKIITDNQYTILLDKDSANNLIKNNTLYASTTFGSKSVKDENSTNRIRINIPNEVVSYIFLNDKTYPQFFDENGTLRDKVPTGITIQLTGNLHGKVLNITRPINLVADNTELINSKLIISSTAKNTNLTGIKLSADSRIIILADESNINITSMDITNTVSDNINLVLIGGNNNNININSIIASSSRDLNSNISVVKLTGKNNKVNLNSLKVRYFNEVNAISLENTLNNSIFLDKPDYISCNDTIYFLAKNSDKNNITFGSIYTIDNINKLTEIILLNSSNNYIAGDFSNYYGASELSVLNVLNNSNTNTFLLNIPRLSVTKTPIIINNSNYNTFMGCYLTFNNFAGHAINIVEGVGNRVEYNIIKTINLQGDLAVLQENINDSVNNIVKNNYKENNASSVRMNVTIPDTIKTQNNLVLNVNLTYKNGTSYSSPYVALENGVLILRINGVEVNKVNVTSGITTINYTLNDNDLNSIYVELIYGDDTLAKNISVINKTINIIKQDSTVVLPNITNDGVQTKVTIVTIDEKGNIVYNGNVTFKLNNEIQTVSIENGIAEVVFDTSKYALGNYKLTAEFNGNDLIANSIANSTLSIIKYNTIIKADSITTLSGNKVLLTANVTDTNGKAVNTGRVIFKLNGCTLKDEKGNTLYANVTNGTATVEYLIPSDYTAKNYTLTAVASSSTYNRTEANSTLTINKTTPKALVVPTTVKRTNNTTITVKFTDSKNNDLIGENKVCIKFNGKTLINTKAVNGTVNVNLDLTNYKNSQYELTVICGANSRYNTYKNVSTLILE